MAMVAGLLEGNVSFLKKEREKNFFFFKSNHYAEQITLSKAA